MKLRHALVAATILIGGCSGLADQLKGVVAVQAELVRTLHEDNISVNLNNGRFLTIGIINSPLHDLSKDQKGAKVFEIAKIAYGALPEREQLERISVVFATQKTYFMFFHYSDGSDSYFVDPREFRNAPEKNRPGSAPGEHAGTPSPKDGVK